jgi:8-oxo-dGTP pyrophosphatase MutT (NUDIX family)
MKITHQAGGIVFRHRSGSVEILLVGPKRGGAEWIFPKGHIEAGESASVTALRESGEEAGVCGFVIAPAGTPIDFTLGSESIRVEYFVIEATGETTPTDTRRRQWFSASEALTAVTHEDARALLAGALPAIEAHIATVRGRT